MLAILEAKRAGLLSLKNLRPNLVAGVIVGIVALPLAMAFAIASGARPEQGIYTAIVASLMVSVCGGSRVQIAGPTGAFIAILAGITARYGIDGLQIATCMAGLMLLVMGLCQMGAVIKSSQGLANIVAPLFGGFAATGAIARTATNIRSGGTSPVAGIVHALTLVVILLVLAPWAAHIPLAALAAILFVAAFNMSDLPHCVRIIRRAPRADAVILLLTFALTVFVDWVVAVNIGVLLAVLHFLRRMAQSVDVRQFAEHELKADLLELNLSELPAGVLVYEVNGPFFFAAVENFERVLLQTHTEPKTLILRLRHVPFMDITGLQALEEAIEALRKRGVRVLLCEANHKVYAKLDKAGVLQAVAPGDYDDGFLGGLARVVPQV